MKKPTVREVAEHAGVSGATVSYILNGRGREKSRISPATTQRVLEAAHKLGYTPNAAARNLRRQRTDRICLVMPALSPYNTLFIRGMQEAADQHGYFTVTAVADTENRELQIFHELRGGFVDGAVLLDTRFLETQQFRQLVQADLALVVVRDGVDADGFDVIHRNEAGASAEAVDYLVRQGHRRIAIFGDLSNMLQAPRVQRYLTLLHERGIDVDPAFVCGNAVGRRTAYAAIQTLSSWSPQPTAILAASDRTAIGCVLGARDVGIRVPEELAIIGFGDIPETEITTPPISTIGQDTIDFQPFADLLFSRLATEAPLNGRTVALHQHLILRGSA